MIYVLLIVTAVSCCVQNTCVSVCGLAWRVHIFYWDTHLYNANIVQNGADYQITLAPRQHWRFGVNSLDWTQSPCKLFSFLIFRSANVYRMRFEQESTGSQNEHRLIGPSHMWNCNLSALHDSQTRGVQFKTYKC
jgi:hypothetical protein